MKRKLHYATGFLPACLLFLWIAFMPGGEAYAQNQKEVRGKVTDKANQTTLPGVNVLIKGTQRGITTDAEGEYAVMAAPDETLVFSFIGYDNYEVAVGNQSVIDVELTSALTNLDELVVVGYGTMKKSDLTGAVVRLDAKTFQNQPMTQLSDMLTGTIAGFNANQGTSAAGGSSMEIRGPKSLNASTSPMVVLDGVIFNGSMADINPADIETVDILKDASSAAVFGARAAAGVILVTTKKGKDGKPTISFSSSVGVAGTTSRYKPYDGEGYLRFRRDAMRANNPSMPSFYYDNPGQLPSGVSLDQWRAASNNPQTDNTREWLSRLRFFDVETENYMEGKTVDWYDQVMRKGTRQNYNVSIGGGAKNVSYYWSLGYENNEGVIRGDQFSAIRSRLNVDFRVTDKISFGANTQFSDRDESNVLANLSQMYVMSPYGDAFDEEGNVVWFPNTFATGSPIINLYGQKRLRKQHNLFSSLYGKVDLPFGISYKLSFQPRYTWLKDYNFYPSTTITGGQTYANGYGTRLDNSEFEYMIDHLVHWNQSFDDHTLDLTLLYNVEKFQDWSSTMSNIGFVPNQNLGFNALQYGTNPGVLSNDRKQTGDAAMARLNYAFKDKYLLTASVRRDGYSAFGIMNPRAVFPALALAWKVSDEDFFKSDIINQFKLRVSWGVNGNRDIGAYSALAQLASNIYYDGTNVQVGVYNNTLSNHSLVWEKTQSLNVGVDMSLWNNRVNATLEAYDMTTTDLLMKRLLPEITGFTDITSNLGKLGNKGLEFNVTTVNVNRADFTWRSALNFSMNRNKIKSLFGDFEEVVENGQTIRRELPDYSNEWFPGQALDRIWNYNISGIWQTEEKDAAAVYRLQPGDFKAEDVDNNGAYEALADKQFIGYSAPRFRFGFRNEFTFLKNFSASVFIRGDLGHMAAFTDGLRRGGSDTYDRRSTIDFPYWTAENPTNEYARLNANTNVFGGGIQFYKSVSFVRVQDVSISYNVPSEVVSRLKLSSLRVFASARNLLTFDKWPGWDPESASNPDTVTQPMPRITTIGLNLSF